MDKSEADILKSVDEAIENGEFQIYLQPQHYLQHEDSILSAEALIRWIKKDGTIIYPGEFIPVLEKNNLISKIDCHVMELACKFINQHINDDWFKNIVISVNVSKNDLKLKDFIKYYKDIRNKYNIPSGRIEIEFTESAVFEDYSAFKSIMSDLRNDGFYCSIDDFGTGSSSLNMLKSMPVDVLKMDRMFFVCENETENEQERNNSVVASVVAMARGLGMKIVAEGIETEEKIDFLRKIGCDVIQGYVYSKPLSLEEFENYVKSYVPKYLPISEKLTPVVPERDEFSDPEILYQRYTQLLPYVKAIVADVDIESDQYRIISYGQNKVLVAGASGYYTNFFDDVIMKNLHPDFLDKSIRVLSLKSILSAFYRGDAEIRTEMMIRLIDSEAKYINDENDGSYRWCLFHIYFHNAKRNSHPVATLFISDIQAQKEQELYAQSAQHRLNAAIKSLQCEIYEYCISDKKALLLHTGIKGDKSVTPVAFSEVINMDEYIKRYVHYDDREKVLKTLQNIEEDLCDNNDYYIEYRYVSDSKDIRWKSFCFVYDCSNTNGKLTLIANDIDERKITELRIERNKRRDPVTGTYSSYDFFDATREYIEREGRDGEHMMIMISLVNFGNMRSEYGLKYSRELEAAFVDNLKKCIRKDDEIGKLDGGIFMLFLKNTGAVFADRFALKVNERFKGLKFKESDISDFCMGISLYNKDEKAVEVMAGESESAMKSAMKNENLKYCIYET